MGQTQKPYYQCNAFFTALLTFKPKAIFSHFISVEDKWIVMWVCASLEQTLLLPMCQTFFIPSKKIFAACEITHVVNIWCQNTLKYLVILPYFPLILLFGCLDH